ncbi:MAG: YbfB/YjiJ family MFS transporter [Rubrivivax sp.]|nr:YbfB/YjiJ family MFS transporter [Rubrivivax sp.]
MSVLLWRSLGLALAAAVSLGLARFSYALLLPPMRADLQWSYLTAGNMNAVNAAGYLLGALAMPALLARVDARQGVLIGGAAAAVLLALHGLAPPEGVLYLLRLALGAASAASFVGGGVLAARLATSPAGAGRSGLVLGLYYGGTGLGIVASALLMPAVLGRPVAHAWHAAWWVLAAAAGVATLCTAWLTRPLAAAPMAAPKGRRVWRPLAAGLAGYFMFGLGYIGYMTFSVTLLREQQLGPGAITGFFVLLGAGVVASSWVWAGLLERARGGRALALLNGLLALATVLPVWSSHPLAALASGALFGGVFISAVASTTAMVRHNLPPSHWPGGIAAFTIVFAIGQVLGPTLVGQVADGAGGLARGFVVSAAVLALGALLAAWQRPLAHEP